MGDQRPGSRSSGSGPRVQSGKEPQKRATPDCRAPATTAAARQVELLLPRDRPCRRLCDRRARTRKPPPPTELRRICHPDRVGLDHTGNRRRHRRVASARRSVSARSAPDGVAVRRRSSSSETATRSGFAAFDGDLLARCVAETRHRELLARTELDLEAPARARRADRPVAAGRLDIIERNAQRVAPATVAPATATPDDERGHGS